MAGRLIVFEGGDGVGKTTQLALLAERLAAAEVPHLVTREPGGTPVGDQIRQLLLDPATGDLAPRAEALLYAADKAQHLAQLVQPALANGLVVLCDRYVDSLLAYQGGGRTLQADDLAWIADWATAGLRADLTVLLDADPAKTLPGLAGKDRIEAVGDGFHDRVRERFLAFARSAPQRYLVVSARAPREVVADQVWQRVRQELPERPGLSQ